MPRYQRITRKEKSESSPPLYDLTTLAAGCKPSVGIYSAQQTLDYAQSLYEKKLITYPSTDSRYITDDDEDMAASLTGVGDGCGQGVCRGGAASIHVQQVINGSKVTDHHALLPTRSMANADLAEASLPKGSRMSCG